MEDDTLVQFLQWSDRELQTTTNTFVRCAPFKTLGFRLWTLHASCPHLTHIFGTQLATGIYSTLANIFKYGQRQSMLDKLPLAITVLAHQREEGGIDKSTSLQRKLISKLAQRLGLTFLRESCIREFSVRLLLFLLPSHLFVLSRFPAHKVAAWRYQRGSRSLLDNLKGLGGGKLKEQQTSPSAVSEEPGAGDEDDSCVPTEIEVCLPHT